MQRRPQSGFTLIELAVVLVIMGLIGYVLYGGIFAYLKQEKVEIGQEQLGRIVTQLQGLALAQGTLPNPTGAGSDILPTSFAYSTDPWRSQVRYWLAPELTGGVAVTGLTSTSLSVEEYSALSGAGTLVGGTLDRTITNVAFVLVNLGPDQTQQVEAAGTTIRVLTRGYGNISGAGTATDVRYDDQAVYQTLNELKAVLLQ